MTRWLFVVASVGCGAPGAKTALDTTDTASDSGGPSGATDEDILREAIDGTRDVVEAMSLIADSQGFPVTTRAGTMLFACICGEGAWQVAGDHDGWAGTDMERAGELWWAEVEVSSPDGSGYKFTDGSRYVADPYARRYRYDDFGELSLVASSAAHIERAFVAESHGLQARQARIWVPEDGVFSHALYAHDGQNLFDPNAMWGGWRLGEALGDHPVMVVGLDNTSDRMDEYTHTPDIIDGVTYGGRADDYAALVADVRAAIEARYGVADRAGLLGSSLGGLVSFAIADLQPGEWDAALSLSGTMGWGSFGTDGDTILNRYSVAGHRDTVLYLDSGGAGTCVDTDGDGIEDDASDDADNYCVNRQFADQLAGSGYTWDTDLFHWHEADAPHNEAAWAARVWRPIEIFVGI